MTKCIIPPRPPGDGLDGHEIRPPQVGGTLSPTVAEWLFDEEDYNNENIPVWLLMKQHDF
jgi:hypothetical protein